MNSSEILRESIFLAIGNWLPRMRSADRIRSRIYRLAGLRIETPATIWGPITLRPLGSASHVKIGHGTFINTDLRLGANGTIQIGKRVAIGPRVSLETTTHSLMHLPARGRGTTAKSIVIEDEVWLGAGVIVTPGVVIGRGAVVAAGAVVVCDIEPMTLWGGVPARLIRRITTDDGEGLSTS